MIGIKNKKYGQNILPTYHVCIFGLMLKRFEQNFQKVYIKYLYVKTKMCLFEKFLVILNICQ